MRERSFGASKIPSGLDLPNTSEAASGIQIIDVGGTSLQGTSQAEYDSTNEDSPFTAKAITGRTGEHGTEEGTSCENGDYGAAEKKVKKKRVSATSSPE